MKIVWLILAALVILTFVSQPDISKEYYKSVVSSSVKAGKWCWNNIKTYGDEVEKLWHNETWVNETKAKYDEVLE